MRRIFFPLSKTAEPGPKKPHTFKMIMPLPHRVRFFCARFTCARFLPATLSAPPPAFTHATLSAPQLLSAPPCPHLAIKNRPGKHPSGLSKSTSVYGFLQLVPVQSVKPALIQKSVFPLHWSFSFTGLVPQSIGTTNV